MKKYFSLRSLTLSLIALTLLAVIVIITTTNSKAAPTLATKLSGRTLLQVEDHGNIWYVSPDNNNQRIELKSPLEIFCFMKILGLGISNNDLNKYLDNKFPTRLAGKILLAVEQHGEAYYINPVTLQGHYLGRPQEAFKLMKGLALGIANTNLNTIEIFDTTKMLEDCHIIIKPNDQEISKIKEKVDSIITNISLVTQELEPMVDFSHIISISTTIDNPNNLIIKEKGLLYDFTFLPDNDLVPTLDKYNKKIISKTEFNNTYSLDITNLTPGSYPFIRAYLITEDNQIIYGNIINFIGKTTNYIPEVPISSSVPTYNLTYEPGVNGSISGSAIQKVSKGKNGTEVEATPNTGYHFINWSDGVTDNPRTDLDVINNLSITANFAINTYTVTFKDYDGSFISSSSVNHGSPATAPADPTRVGYTFTDWKVAFNNITSDLTVTAQYTINFYTLTYTAGSGGTLTGSSTQSVNYGSNGTSITAVPGPVYAFVKWSDDSTDNPRIDTNITGNMSREAQFELICPDATVSYEEVTYNTVAIGGQCWFQENLKYLPMVHNNSEFKNQGEGKLPGYGVYGYNGNNIATAKGLPNYSTYGVLYNWYAIDQVNICPTGWHVPTYAEWTILISSLGGESVAGGKMKEVGTVHWRTPNIGAINSSGFTALPAGGRNGNGDFSRLGDNAGLWSSSECGGGYSMFRDLRSGSSGVSRGTIYQAYGLSVRCLRD